MKNKALIFEYCKQFPNTPSLTLSKKIYKEHPEKFNSIESVRDRVRYYRGNKGIKDKKCAKPYIDYLEKLKSELPKGETEKLEPYYLPKDRKKVLIISDIHLPYHDDKALFAALEYGLKEQVDTIYINGDLLDFA
jgi:hypothetical protein